MGCAEGRVPSRLREWLVGRWIGHGGYRCDAGKDETDVGSGGGTVVRGRRTTEAVRNRQFAITKKHMTWLPLCLVRADVFEACSLD